jgi:hypothetical protein
MAGDRRPAESGIGRLWRDGWWLFVGNRLAAAFDRAVRQNKEGAQENEFQNDNCH